MNNLIRDVMPPQALTPSSEKAAVAVPTVVSRVVPQPSDVTSRPPTNFRPAKLIEGIKPGYPSVGRAEDLTGTVQVSATIGKDGVPRAIRLLKGSPNLGQPAIEAIAQWRYAPALLNGETVEAQTVVTMTFRAKP